MVMPNDDPEVLAAVRRYVIPDRRYGKLHGWNLKHMDPALREDFARSLSRAATQISNSELVHLLKGDWRARLTASWLIGLTQRTEFRALLGKLIDEANSCEAAKGYCFAFARFGSYRDSELLITYLDSALTENAPACAQPWALGALLRNDLILGTRYAPPFTDQGGAWERWSGSTEIPGEKALIEYLCEFAEACIPSNSKPRHETTDPLHAYRNWKLHSLPEPWTMITSERERKSRDEKLRQIEAENPPSALGALAVAECRQCSETLFSALKPARWVTVRWEELNEPRTGVSEFNTFDSFELAHIYMARHSH